MNQSTQLQDIVLKISAGPKEEYSLHILDSPFGTMTSSFKIPISHSEFVELMETLETSIWEESTELRDCRQRNRSTTPTMPLVELGRRLFNSLFSDGSLRRFLLALGEMESDNTKGLRIRIVVDPAECGWISALPWEFIYRDDTRDFLCRNPRTPVVRSLEVLRRTSLEPCSGPLRILIVNPDAHGVSPLDSNSEVADLVSTLTTHADTQVEVLKHATLSQLHAQLAYQSIHVVHFIGHGRFDEGGAHGSLVFCDHNRRANLVSAKALGDVLKAGRDLRLVFLNACRTAQMPRRDGLDPFSGAASGLIMAGVPFVVAMQFPISDRAAIEFSKAFYQALAHGLPIDTAVSQGRLSLYASAPASWEWATPVLFTGFRDCHILAKESVDRSRLAEEPESRTSPTKQAAHHGTIGAPGGITVGGENNRSSRITIKTTWRPKR